MLETIKKHKGDILLAFFSIIFTILLIEGILHLWKNYPGPLGYPDAELGYLLRDGVNKKMVNSESKEDVTVHTNQYGFRDDDWDFKSSTPKIMMVGDSFVAGFETEEENRFSELLQKKLSASSSVQVLNFGIPGSGPEAYIRRIEKYYSQINPEYVVFVIYNGNDLANLNYDLTPDTGRINYKVVDGVAVPYNQIASANEKIVWAIKTFVGKIYLVQFLNDVYLKTKPANLATAEPKTTPEYCAYGNDNMSNSFIILDKILTDAKKIAGDKLIVLDIPDKKQIDFNGAPDCSQNVIERNLEKFVQENNINYVEALSDFNVATTTTYNTEHLNEHGHQVVAQLLTDKINQLRKLPSLHK